VSVPPCCWAGRGGGASGFAISTFDEPSVLLDGSAFASGPAPVATSVSRAGLVRLEKSDEVRGDRHWTMTTGMMVVGVDSRVQQR
jgi:hypothetical protein